MAKCGPIPPAVVQDLRFESYRTAPGRARRSFLLSMFLFFFLHSAFLTDNVGEGSQRPASFSGTENLKGVPSPSQKEGT